MTLARMIHVHIDDQLFCLNHKYRKYQKAYWLYGDMLLSNSTFLIFAVLVVQCSRSRPYRTFYTVKFFYINTISEWMNEWIAGSHTLSTSFTHNVQQQYQNSAVLSIKHNEQKLIQWVMVYEK